MGVFMIIGKYKINNSMWAPILVILELSDFLTIFTVIRYHLCHKSVHEIYKLLNLPWSSVSAIILNHVGITTAQPQSCRPCQLRGWLLMCVACDIHLSSVVTYYSSKLLIKVTSAQELCVWSFMEWIFMVKQLHTMCNAQFRLGIKHTTTGF